MQKVHIDLAAQYKKLSLAFLCVQTCASDDDNISRRLRLTHFMFVQKRMI
jgi:hypothetical protein